MGQVGQIQGIVTGRHLHQHIVSTCGVRNLMLCENDILVDVLTPLQMRRNRIETRLRPPKLD